MHVRCGRQDADGWKVPCPNHFGGGRLSEACGNDVGASAAALASSTPGFKSKARPASAPAPVTTRGPADARKLAPAPAKKPVPAHKPKLACKPTPKCAPGLEALAHAMDQVEG